MSSRLEDQRAGYCRHCGDRLPLIKRVKREEFCSEDHRELYLNSTKTVALDRLRESDAQMQSAPEMAHERVAVAEMAAPMEQAPQAPPEPPDPPMAGTIGPRAVDAPLRLMTLFDSEDHRIGQWEPVRPEPQWHSIALQFGLAEFHEAEPAPMAEENSELARTIDEQAPAELRGELAFPRSISQLAVMTELSPDQGLGSEDDAGTELDDDARAPAFTYIDGTEPATQTMTAHRIAPLAEALDLDTMLYLPGFSPQAEMQSLGDRGWALAES